MAKFKMIIDLQDRSTGTGWAKIGDRRSQETVDARREDGKWIIDGTYDVELRGEGRTLQQAAKMLMRVTGCTEGRLEVGKEYGNWDVQFYDL
jgi:hypothetical protein